MFISIGRIIQSIMQNVSQAVAQIMSSTASALAGISPGSMNFSTTVSIDKYGDIMCDFVQKHPEFSSIFNNIPGAAPAAASQPVTVEAVGVTWVSYSEYGDTP